jgi:hypothetical protein
MMADELLQYAQGRAVIADTGYDADRIIAAVRAKGVTAVILHLAAAGCGSMRR